VIEGAYFAKHLARPSCKTGLAGLLRDPLMTIRVFADIGGTGAKADAFSMWVAQFVGKEIRVLDYYEAVGQPIGAHLEWLRSSGV
jgi:phage terminase large subunit